MWINDLKGEKKIYDCSSWQPLIAVVNTMFCTLKTFLSKATFEKHCNEDLLSVMCCAVFQSLKKKKKRKGHGLHPQSAQIFCKNYCCRCSLNSIR